MKKFLLTFMFLFVMVFVVSGVSHGWQGRMAGMEDPYGLISDESDYLIHVAEIAKGQGVKVYGGYRFTYTKVKTWETEFDGLVLDIPGKELKHEALLGSSFALGPGRMGVFFAYDGKRGDYDTGLIEGEGVQHKDDLDNFALKLMYGIPVGNFNFGVETGIAYRKEKSDLLLYSADSGAYNIHVIEGFSINVYIPPFIPYDSTYWEVPLKAGFSGKMGPVDTQFTIRGGIIVAGKNTLNMGTYGPSDATYDDLDGDTKGWSIGADFWLRYHLGNGLSLPFMVRADYQKKTRDARGSLVNLNPDIFLDYKNEETALNLTLGGGVEKAFDKNTRLATGFYYSYLNNNKDISTKVFDLGVYEVELFFNDFPSTTEHRVTLRLAGEHSISPVVAFRAGMGFFYGWVTQDLVLGIRDSVDTEEIKFDSDGTRWGVGASFGASIKLTPVTLEPFINAGYQHLKLSGDTYDTGVLMAGFVRDDKREQWYVGGGLAVMFGQ
jgi:hypothetical protein